MKVKYKLKGLSKAALYLDNQEREQLREMIGSEIFIDEKETEHRSGIMYIMPDNELCHGRFLIVEITPNNKCTT